jgi:hypothetical protein
MGANVISVSMTFHLVPVCLDVSLALVLVLLVALVATGERSPLPTAPAAGPRCGAHLCLCWL